MSCFICNDETLSAISKTFIDYRVSFSFKNFNTDYDLHDRQTRMKIIGQILLNENIKAYKCRYGRCFKDIEKGIFKLKDVAIDEGIVFGCLRCYNYQTSELPDWESNDVYKSLLRLQVKIAERLIYKCCQEMPWGYPKEFN